MKQVIQPTIDGFAKEGIPYKGFLFAGMMIDKNGSPKLLEYNIRFGDPEAQVIFSRLESDLVEILLKASCKRLHEVESINLSKKSALCVVMAAKGYPEKYDKGHKIDLSATTSMSNLTIYHAGTKLEKNQLVSSGGRVLGVTGIGETLVEAKDSAYNAIAAIKADGLFNRTDIGYRELNRNS